MDEWDHDGDQYVECDLDVILDLWESQQDSILLGGSDCDDTRDYVHPTATICNGQYDNCDNRIVLDGVVTNSPPLEFDDDGDGYVECEINPNMNGWDRKVLVEIVMTSEMIHTQKSFLTDRFMCSRFRR